LNEREEEEEERRRGTTVANTMILVLSKQQQGHVAAGFRKMQSRFAGVSLQQSRQRRMVFSSAPTILNTAAAAVRYHPQGRCFLSSYPRTLLLRRPLFYPSPPWLLPSSSTAPEAKGGGGGVWHSSRAGGVGCSGLAAPFQLQLQQMDKRNKTSYRSSASKSTFKNHYNKKRSPSKHDGVIRKSVQELHEVVAMWDGLWDAVHKSRKRDQQDFWIDNMATLQPLIDQTIHSAEALNGRSTATVTHRLLKLVHYTKSKKVLETEPLLSLWDALLHKTALQNKTLIAFDISNLLWAYAQIDGIQVDDTVLDHIAHQAELCVYDFAPQGLMNVAYGYATMNHKAPVLFDAITDAAQACIDDFNPQALSKSAWAFAKLQHDAPWLFDDIARVAQVRINEFIPQSLSTLLWAFATANHQAPSSLLDAIADAVQACLDDFNPQQLANTLWAFATLNHKAPSSSSSLLREALARASRVGIQEFNKNPQDLANIAWAFAVFDMSEECRDFIHTYIDAPFGPTLLSRASDPSQYSVEKLRQLHQLKLWSQEQAGISWYPDPLSLRCREVFASIKVEPSRKQNDIVNSLRALENVSHVEQQVQAKESGYILDAVIVYRGIEIGVEINGPSHFVGRSQTPNGRTILKHRQVRAYDSSLKLVSVPYWEWDAIDAGSDYEKKEMKHTYLQNLLDEAVVGPW
jgi:RAP domain